MRILHYYNAEEAMTAQHVGMLQDSMGLEADNHLATTVADARTLLQGGSYDILHVHGCWRNSSRTVVNTALRKGCRLVVTPHGQLQPWVKNDHYLKEKLPKELFYQRNIIRKAYAVIVQGPLEQATMEKVDWNRRLVNIRNSVLTSTITPKEMARKTFALYRKVMDTNTLELMDVAMRSRLKTILMAGITGDRRWLPEEDTATPTPSVPWRELLLYAHHEQVTDTLMRGLRLLNMDAPDIDVEHIDHFWPDGYEEAPLVGTTIGNQFVTENDRLLATFRVLRKLAANRQLGIKHLVELDRELRQHGCDEEELEDTLKERQLWKLARRLMQLMSDLTGLTEGFMPVAPLDDRKTRQMRLQIENHLKL